jgi:hypothetical protein
MVKNTTVLAAGNGRGKHAGMVAVIVGSDF